MEKHEAIIMNKRNILIIALVLGSFGVIITSYPVPEKIHYLEADLITYSNFAQLKEHSDLVIIVR